MHNAACTIPVIECTQEPFECSVYSSHLCTLVHFGAVVAVSTGFSFSKDPVGKKLTGYSSSFHGSAAAPAGGAEAAQHLGALRSVVAEAPSALSSAAPAGPR